MSDFLTRHQYRASAHAEAALQPSYPTKASAFSIPHSAQYKQAEPAFA